MKFKTIFYHLNNLLLICFIFLVFLLLKGENVKVFSQQNKEQNISSGSDIPDDNGVKGLEIVNTEYKVVYDINEFTAHFVSDGITDGATASQKQRADSIHKIPLPVTFSVDQENTKLLMPGEPRFESIADIHSPIDHECSEEDTEGCFRKVTAIAVFSNAVSTRLNKDLSWNPSDGASEENNVFIKLITTVRKIYENIDLGIGQALISAGWVDDSRYATGLVSYWGDDDYQQFVPIDGGGGRRPVLTTRVDVESLGVNISENTYATDLSNTVNLSSENLFKRPAWALALNLPSVTYIGLGDVYEPFTKFDNEEVSRQKFTNILKERVLNFILKAINRSNLSQVGIKKIAHQVPIREINGPYNKLEMAFVLPEAVSKYFGHLPPYPNPISSTEPPRTIRTPDGRIVPNPLHQKWSNYENLSPVIKKTLTLLHDNADNKNIARDCALKLADDPGAGCDEFSAEESNFNISMRENTFPLGLVSSSWTSIFNQVNTNIHGPYINPLAKSLCGILQISYKLKPGERYIYRISSQNKKPGGTLTGNDHRVIEHNLLNTYCAVGAGLANFAKALMAQVSALGGKVTDRQKLPLDKDAMTCDKKEREYRVSSFYINRNLPFEFEIEDLDYSYLALVSFTPDQVRIPFSNCNENNLKNCRYLSATSFYVGKGDDIYGLSDFPNDDFNKLFAYANPEDDAQLIIQRAGVSSNPKYLFLIGAKSKNFGADEEEGSLRQLLCKVISFKNTQKKLSPCITISDRWGFPRGSAIRNIQVYDEKAGTYKSFDLVTLAYIEDDTSLKYKFVVIDYHTMNHAVLGEQGYELVNGDLLVTAMQDDFGSLTLAYLKRDRDSINEIRAVRLVPDDIKLRINAEGKLVVDSFTHKKLNLTTNLCQTSNLCQIFSGDRFLNKISIFTELKSFHIAGLTDGLGFIFAGSLSVEEQNLTPMWFAYVKQYDNRTESYDEVSAFKYDYKNKEYYIFTGRNGYFLHIIPKERYAPWGVAQVGDDVCTAKNCLLTIQMYFDPSQFFTDTSQYNGDQDDQGNTLQEIGWPIVKDFDLKPNGDIAGVYVYKGLGGALIYSDDIVYAFRGVYVRLSQESNEASNAYLPSTSLEPKPVRYFNRTRGGLLIGRDLIEKSNGNTYKENIGINAFSADSNENIPVLKGVWRGYDSDNRREYVNCLAKFLGYSFSDPYTALTGILPLSLNSVSLEDKIVSIVENRDSNNASSGVFSEFRPDKYCEEKWCIRPDFEFVNNPKYRKTPENQEALKRDSDAVTAFLIDYHTRGGRLGRSITAQQIQTYTSKICDKASERGIPCALMVALWIQESTARPVYLAFGCYFRTQDTQEYNNFGRQVECAVNTVANHFERYKKGSNKIERGDRPESGIGRREYGTCEAANAFSYVMQKYTPIDQRVNTDNQCNTGIVIRPDHIRNQYCNTRGRLLNPKSVPTGLNGWGELLDSRITLRVGLEGINNYLPEDRRIPITRACFPSDNASPDSNSQILSPDVSGSVVLKDFGDFKLVGTPGRAVINLQNWRDTYPAKALAFAANRLEYGNNVRINTPFQEKGEGATESRVFVIAPGEHWSFNRSIMPVGENGQLILDLPQFIRDTDRSSLMGAGWCDLATAIRLAAELVTGPNGEKIKSNPGNPRVLLDGPYGTNSGYGVNEVGEGDIFHWTHSNPSEVARSFERRILETPKGLLDGDNARKFVSIFLSTRGNRNRNGTFGGDLAIRNSSERYYLLLKVDYVPSENTDRKVIIEWSYATKSG